jgi:hypothetical protein
VVGAQAADYPTLQSFLDDPLVQDLIARGGFTLHFGSTPPVVEGSYDLEVVVETSDDPEDVGDTTRGPMCLFGQSPGRISLRDDADEYADMFITGTGDAFTIWFVVEDSAPFGSCVATEVTVLTGNVLPGGHLDARLGVVLVGWRGSTCDDYFPDPDADLGTIVIAAAQGTLTGPPCQ